MKCENIKVTILSKILHLLPPGVLVLLPFPLQQVVVGVGSRLGNPKDPVDGVGRVSAMGR